MKYLFKKYSIQSAILFILFVFTGCFSNDIANCPSQTYLRFMYTKNVDNVCHFQEQVEHLDLYLYDGNDKFIKKQYLPTNALSEGSRLLLDLAPGNYTAVVWANVKEEHFACTPGATLQDMKLDLKCPEDGHVTTDPGEILHGIASVTITEFGDQEHVVSMIKNTNRVHIVLEDITPISSYSAFSDNPYSLAITGSNGSYNYDNTLADGAALNYIPQYTIAGNTTQADFTILRIRENDDLQLTIQANGKEIHTERLATRLMENPRINGNDDFDRIDDYTLHYHLIQKEDGAHVVTLISINDWDVTHTGGGI